MDYLSLSGVVLGIFLIIIYLYYSYIKGLETSLTQAAILLLSGSGIIAGIKVIVFSFNSELLSLLDKEGIEGVHIILGGIAISWVSSLASVDVFKNLIKHTGEKLAINTSNANKS